jgi:hypothetical protein
MTFTPNDYSRLIELAERMGLSSEYAVREFMDLTQRRSAPAVPVVRRSRVWRRRPIDRDYAAASSHAVEDQ